MGTLNFLQILIAVLLIMLLFGDVKSLKFFFFSKFLKPSKKYKKTGKKGIEPLSFGFGNHCSTY